MTKPDISHLHRPPSVPRRPLPLATSAAPPHPACTAADLRADRRSQLLVLVGAGPDLAPVGRVGRFHGFTWPVRCVARSDQPIS